MAGLGRYALTKAEIVLIHRQTAASAAAESAANSINW
ncbi:hypothetical protein EM595_1814 [Duffyella gerundensis]|uniref:Uncharacterized protein n=1 Tax=Duffyella gerundensis TaxID=1619313 RepID=A0A0U5L4F4_9GAMM|nr:hypothetical protein EM595_1814 [Duffyella gerundensis]